MKSLKLSLGLIATYVVAILCGLATARGAEPQFAVANKTAPVFVVTNKTAPQAIEDQRGVWSPYWDGRQWVGRWIQKEVSRTASPFRRSTATTSATGAGRSSTSSAASIGTVPTITLVPGVAMYGGTNCPPGVP